MDIQYELHTKSSYCHNFTNFEYKKMHDIKMHKKVRPVFDLEEERKIKVPNIHIALTTCKHCSKFYMHINS